MAFGFGTKENADDLIKEGNKGGNMPKKKTRKKAAEVEMIDDSDEWEDEEIEPEEMLDEETEEVMEEIPKELPKAPPKKPKLDVHEVCMKFSPAIYERIQEKAEENGVTTIVYLQWVIGQAIKE